MTIGFVFVFITEGKHDLFISYFMPQRSVGRQCVDLIIQTGYHSDAADLASRTVMEHAASVKYAYSRGSIKIMIHQILS